MIIELITPLMLASSPIVIDVPFSVVLLPSLPVPTDKSHDPSDQRQLDADYRADVEQRHACRHEDQHVGTVGYRLALRTTVRYGYPHQSSSNQHGRESDDAHGYPSFMTLYIAVGADCSSSV